jgi:hypothetical protein
MQKTKLALFPLQILLLPGEKMRLHIFEERYRQLLVDCREMNIPFGIPFTLNGNLTGYGCVAKLTKVIQEHGNGASDIEIEAIQIFKITQYYNRLGEKLYPGGEVDILDNLELNPVSEELMQELGAYMKKAKMGISPALLSTHLNPFDIGSILSLSEIEKLKLIRGGSHENRERILMNHLKILDKMLEQKNSIQGSGVQGEIFLN